MKTFEGGVFNPLSPNVADLQHFDIELFCGFSLRNAFCPSTNIITVSLLVLPLSLALVIPYFWDHDRHVAAHEVFKIPKKIVSYILH